MRKITRLEFKSTDDFGQGVVVWYDDKSVRYVWLTTKQFVRAIKWANQNFIYTESLVSDSKYSLFYTTKENKPERNLVMERTAIELATESIRMQKELIDNQDKTINTLYAVRASYEKALTDIYKLLPSIKGSSWITGVDQIEEIVEDALRLGKSE